MNLETCTRKQLVAEVVKLQQQLAASKLSMLKVRTTLIPKYEAETNKDKVLIQEMSSDLAFHPRAGKLMHKRKDFVVVACDEPYFSQVYAAIRGWELTKGTWTKEDEEKFLKSIPEYIQEESKGKSNV